MNIKYGLLYMLAVFGIASMMFSMKNGTGAVAYMFFCGMIITGTTFGTTKQTVSLTALLPGSAWQKVAGRYLSGVLCIVVCAGVGLLSAGIVRLMGRAKGTLDLPILLCLFGITLFFLAVQNVLLYLLTPYLGTQVVSLVRMVPGFILFFVVMNAGRLEMITGILEGEGLSAGIVLVVLGVGVASMVLSGIFSCLIIRNRDNE